jgi:hypothetical protein
MLALRFGSSLAWACYFLVAPGLFWKSLAWACFLPVIAAWYSTLHYRRFGPVVPWACYLLLLVLFGLSDQFLAGAWFLLGIPVWYWTMSSESTWCRREMDWCTERCEKHIMCRLVPDLVINQTNRMMSHWPLMCLLLFVYLIAAGRLGGDYGLPWLYRDDPSSQASLGNFCTSRSLWGAFALNLLMGQIWTVIYLSMFTTNFISQRKPPAVTSAPGPYPGEVWADPALKYFCYKNYLQFFFGCTPPFMLLLLMIACFPGEAPGGLHYTHAIPWRDLLEYFIGMALGAGAVLGGARLVWVLEKRLLQCKWSKDFIYYSVRFFETQKVKVSKGEGSEKPADREKLASRITAAMWGFVLVNVFWTLLMMIVGQWVPIVPVESSVAISILLAMVVVGYFVLISLRTNVRPWAVIGLVLSMACSNSGSSRYRLPGMREAGGRSLYESPQPIELPRDDHPEQHAALVRTSAVTNLAKPLLNSQSVLANWKDCERHAKRPRPKLVLITVSGGGYRAGFWTTIVLDELNRLGGTQGKLKGFSDSVRMITGASGGMVGAAYFVTTRRMGRASAKDQLIEDTHHDSLTPVVKQFVLSDIPRALFPFDHLMTLLGVDQMMDRGIVLEEEWKYLNKTEFSESYLDEKAGRRPSLVVSPMIIETGQRMLFSNLDLSELAQPQSEAARKIRPPGIEFFKVFPAAQNGFLLRSAVRTSATFPYICPAVSLPYVQPRRLVDAGYYDNYGTNLAVAWAFEHREWIRDETSGLVLVQIRAYPNTNEEKKGKGGLGDWVFGLLGSAFEWLTGPLEGVNSARDWTMLDRNDEQVRMLGDLFNKPNSKMFETVIFAHRGGAAMNWFIAPESIKGMEKDFSDPGGENQATLQRLSDWWNRPR